jgi:dTDP-L-rhamnose 4-epimerase
MLDRSEKVLVTGGLGFIGATLVRQLARDGYGVTVLDNLSAQVHGELPVVDRSLFTEPGVILRRGDVTDRDQVESAIAEVDFVVHLAAETGTAQSMYQIARYERVNGYGTAVLLDVLANRPHRVKRLVLASSRAIYGEGQYRCPKDGVVQPRPRHLAALERRDWDVHCPHCGQVVGPIATSETAEPRPASVYAATKLAQEELVRVACHALGIAPVILRFQNVYGPGQSLQNPYTGILSIFSTRIRQGLDLPIFEDGLESRDFVHVCDVATAIRLSLASERAGGRTLNVGSGKPTPIREVAEELVRTLGGRSEVLVTGGFRVGDIRHCWADLAALREVTGYEPTVDLGQGLAGFAEWALSQPLYDDGLAHANGELRARGFLR